MILNSNHNNEEALRSLPYINSVIVAKKSTANILQLSKNIKPMNMSHLSSKFLDLLKSNYLTALDRDMKLGQSKKFSKSTDQKFLSILNTNYGQGDDSGVVIANNQVNNVLDRKSSGHFSLNSKKMSFSEHVLHIKEMSNNKNIARSKFSIMQAQKSKLEVVNILAHYKKNRESNAHNKVYGLLLSTMPTVQKAKIMNAFTIKSTKCLPEDTINLKSCKTQTIRNEDLINQHPSNYCDFYFKPDPENIKNEEPKENQENDCKEPKRVAKLRRNSIKSFCHARKELEESPSPNIASERRLPCFDKHRRTVNKLRHIKKKSSVPRISVSNYEPDGPANNNIDNESRFCIKHLNKSGFKQRRARKSFMDVSNINLSKTSDFVRSSIKPKTILFDKPDTRTIWMKMIDRLLEVDELSNHTHAGYYQYLKIDSGSFYGLNESIADQIFLIIGRDLECMADDELEKGNTDNLSTLMI